MLAIASQKILIYSNSGCSFNLTIAGKVAGDVFDFKINDVVGMITVYSIRKFVTSTQIDNYVGERVDDVVSI